MERDRPLLQSEEPHASHATLAKYVRQHASHARQEREFSTGRLEGSNDFSAQRLVVTNRR
jgi:hypothetical protein